jgi:hypothetical protein
MVMRAEVWRALAVGVVVAIVGGLVWFLEGPIPARSAVVWAAAVGMLVLRIWSVTWAWGIHYHEAQQRELRRRLKGIDSGGQ